MGLQEIVAVPSTGIAALLSERFLSMDPRLERSMKAYRLVEAVYRGDSGMEQRLKLIKDVTYHLVSYLWVTDPRIINAALLRYITLDFPKQWTIQRIAVEFGRETAWLVEIYAAVDAKEEADVRYDSELFQLLYNAPRGFFLIKLMEVVYGLVRVWEYPKEQKIGMADVAQRYLYWARRHCVLIQEIQAGIASIKETTTTRSAVSK